jgi:hypothetical protein
VKGKKEASPIFEILNSNDDETRRIKILTKTDFEKGINVFNEDRKKDAEDIFQEVLKQNPNDQAVRHYIQSCKNN